MRPYIGITGFMSRDEVRLAYDFFKKARLAPDYMFMVGVLASLKTLYGFVNKRPNRYPMKKSISEIFIPDPDIDILNLVHYNTKNTELLFVQLMAMTELIGVERFDGFQLNIPWPDELELLTYKFYYPDKKIVLQVGGGALEMIQNSPEKLVKRLTRYTDLVDYILLDPSGGRGKIFDGEQLLNYLVAAEDGILGNVGLGVAGGLSGETMHLVEPLLQEFPNISIDAEARLRNENDHLDMNLVEGYISKAAEIFEKYRKT